MKNRVIWLNFQWSPSNILFLKIIWVGLTHWGRVTHICVSNLIIIGSDNGLSPGWHQAIILTNAGIFLIGPLGTNFSEILIEILTLSFEKWHLKVLPAKWRPFCLGLNVLILPEHHLKVCCILHSMLIITEPAYNTILVSMWQCEIKMFSTKHTSCSQKYKWCNGEKSFLSHIYLDGYIL